MVSTIHPFQPPSRRLLAARLVGAVAWLAFIALLAAAGTHTAFAPVFAVVLAGALACGVLALAWLTLWAQRQNSLPGQFTIASLLFATCFAAIFFAAVRWLGSNLAFIPPRSSPSGSVYLGVAFSSLLIVAISIPIVLGMLDALLRMAIWFMRRPAVRPWVRFVLRGVRRVGNREFDGME